MKKNAAKKWYDFSVDLNRDEVVKDLKKAGFKKEHLEFQKTKDLRSALVGLAELADIPFLPADIKNAVTDQKSGFRPSKSTEKGFDAIFGDLGIPKTDRQKIRDKVIRFGSSGVIGAGAAGKGLKMLGTESVPYVTKSAKFLKNALKPTVPGAVGVVAGQTVLNRDPENVLGALGANLAGSTTASLAGSAAKGVAKGARNLVKAEYLGGPGYDFTHKKRISDPGDLKQIEKEISRLSGGQEIDKFPKDVAGKDVQSGVAHYMERKKNHFNKQYGEIEKLVKKNMVPKENIHVDMSKPSRALGEDYFKLIDPVQQDAYLKTPTGKMWLRIMNMSPDTDSHELSKILHKTPSRYENPKLNIAEAQQLDKALRDSVTTFGEIGSGPKQQLKQIAGMTKTEIGNTYRRINPEAADKYAKTNKEYKIYAERDIPISNEVSQHKGISDKAFLEVIKDLDKGATPLSAVKRMMKVSDTKRFLPGNKQENISKGVLHNLGNVDNEFDISTFDKAIRKLSKKEQSVVKQGLNADTLSKLEEGLGLQKALGEVNTRQSLPIRFAQMVSPKMSKAESLLDSGKRLDQNQIENTLDYVRKLQVPEVTTPSESRHLIKRSIMQTPTAPSESGWTPEKEAELQMLESGFSQAKPSTSGWTPEKEAELQMLEAEFG